MNYGKASIKPRGPDGITPRQLQVLTMASEGIGYKVIADRLGVKTTTISTTVMVASAHLGAKNVTHAVALAMRHGLIR